MSIEYRSTRGKDEKRYQFTDALLTSTASDGGLLVPAFLPAFSLSDFYRLVSSPYSSRAQFVVNSFQPNLDPSVVAEDARRAYGENFDHPAVAPVVRFKPGQYMLELWHGPTAAFKDMALQLMPLMFSRAVRHNSTERERYGQSPLHYLILVATSGDTGKAALEGYRDVPDCSIITFYPDQRVSRLQELQMITQEGDNVGVHAMNGDFDDVQTAVKDTFDDKAFGEALGRNKVILSSANSINWGRIIPQIAYHVSAYVDLMDQGVISPGSKIDIAVPTGNFGNLLSAFYAKQMGLPIGRLICASNENNVLTAFLQTGVYDIRKRTLKQTPSPSMDILVASNIERLLYTLTGNPQKVGQWMFELRTHGVFVVDPETTERLKEEFYAGWVSNEECLDNIRKHVEEIGYLMDPHTSVAQVVAEEYLEQEGSSRPIIICSTAHWSKFATDVRDALMIQPADPDYEFAAIEQVGKLVPGTYIPRNISELREKRIRHTEKFDANVDGVKTAVNRYLDRR